MSLIALATIIVVTLWVSWSHLSASSRLKPSRVLVFVFEFEFEFEFECMSMRLAS